MKAIGLGWGVQSFTLAAMSALGELEPVDVALHANTTHEVSATYAFAERWTPWLNDHGVRVVTVSGPHTQPVDGIKGPKTDIPVFTTDGHGSRGQLRRQCTHRWKIQPMRRWLQANRNGTQVESGLASAWTSFSV